jgi:phosphoribosylaminoimidazole-succinocarboxamide synthase
MSGFGQKGAPAAPEIAGWKHLKNWKRCDLYQKRKSELLIVASDRISAFDWVLPTEYPNKGKVADRFTLFSCLKCCQILFLNHSASTEVTA